MRAGGDVEKDHFVGALLVVAHSQFHRVAHVAQFPGLGLAELNAARDLAVVDIQTRNNTFRNHVIIENPAPAKAKQNDVKPSISVVSPATKQNLSAYLIAGVEVLREGYLALSAYDLLIVQDELNLMNNNPAFNESLVPSLFQIASRTATKPAPKDRGSLSETMLDPRRLEAILKSIGKKKKSLSRRTG
jgi:hypothetical protein